MHGNFHSTTHPATRGEMVIVIGGARSDYAGDEGSQSTKLAERMRDFESEGIDAKTALKKAARELGLKRDEAYRLWEAQKNRRSK